MFLRAVLAFLALPGIVAFALPILWLVLTQGLVPIHFYGLIPLTLGIVALLWTVRDFYVVGKGTLAPWSPPQHLVQTGLYCYSRNPMYVAVALILIGWTVSYHSPNLLIYTVCVAIAFQLRVVFGEEKWLARKHGQAWNEYKKRVPRWLI
jgi:protein-S-isoprenylcysteine O-methyltransferase Ste14